IRWPKYWSFSFNISATNEHPGLISFRMDWLGVTRSHCACPETKKADGESITEQEEHCGQLTEAHKECMRALGLKI
ncbi:hypothetical protein K5549_020930, partial [Capra hircus]